MTHYLNTSEVRIVPAPGRNLSLKGVYSVAGKTMASKLGRRAVALVCGWAALASALSASGTDNVDWPAAQLVTLELVDERFVPNKLGFRRGVPYRVRLSNTGTAMHEFTAPEFLKAVTVKNPEALDPERREIVLQPKEQRDVHRRHRRQH